MDLLRENAADDMHKIREGSVNVQGRVRGRTGIWQESDKQTQVEVADKTTLPRSIVRSSLVRRAANALKESQMVESGRGQA